jgi:hypothetical protein
MACLDSILCLKHHLLLFFKLLKDMSQILLSSHNISIFLKLILPSKCPWCFVYLMMIHILLCISYLCICYLCHQTKGSLRGCFKAGENCLKQTNGSTPSNYLNSYRPKIWSRFKKGLDIIEGAWVFEGGTPSFYSSTLHLQSTASV